MYFQNIVNSEFVGAMTIDDNQYNLSWRLKGNVNTPNEMVTWKDAAYVFGSDKDLTIKFSLDYANYFSTITVTFVTGIYNAQQIVDILNADTDFAAWMIAETADPIAIGNNVTTPQVAGYPKRVKIRTKKRRDGWFCYIENSGAELELGFNVKAPVGDLPSYMLRHTVGNIPNYSNGLGMLIQLDEYPINTINSNYIAAAGFVGNAQEDWQLLKGRNGTFAFTLNSFDGSSRLDEQIIFNAGNVAGDMAIKRYLAYTGAATVADTDLKVPYVLTQTDIDAAAAGIP